MEKIKTGIYKITSPHNKIYIGQSWNIKDRWRRYKYSSTKRQHKLYNSFQKHGIENHIFEIIHLLDENITQIQLDYHEVFFWKLYITMGYEMLNIREPSSRGKLSDETKKKMSENMSGEKHFYYGKHFTEEHKRKISLGNLGKKLGALSEQHKANISKSKKENPWIRTQKYRDNMSFVKKGVPLLALRGKKQSKERIEKRVSQIRGKKQTQEHIKKVADQKKKPILQYSLDGSFIKEWESAKDASIAFGLKRGYSFNRVAVGERKKAHGYIWKYKIN